MISALLKSQGTDIFLAEKLTNAGVNDDADADDDTDAYDIDAIQMLMLITKTT